MKVQRRALLEASRQRTLVRVRFQTPVGLKVSVTGAVLSMASGGKKVRLHRFDEMHRRFAFDDTGAPETITVPLTKTLSVRPLYGTYVPEGAHQEHAFFDVPSDDHRRHVAGLQVLHVANRITPINHLTTDDAFVENLRYRETLLGAVRHGRFFPLLSKPLTYNVRRNTWIVGEPTWHHEQPLKTLLKRLPDTVMDEETLRPYARRDVTLTSEPQRFSQRCAIDIATNKRLAILGEMRPNRPMRAYFGNITAKNLGRRGYALAPADADALMCATKALKHPLTVAFENRHGETKRRLSAIVDAALLNDMEVLIVDPHHRVNLKAKTVLDLRDEARIDEALDALFSGIDSEAYNALETNDTDAVETLMRQVEKNTLHAARQRLAKGLSHTLRMRGQAMAAMRVESVFEPMSRGKTQSDVRPVYAIADKHASSEALAYARFGRLGLSGYQSIRDLARIDNADKRRVAFRKKLQKIPAFHLIKKLFSAIVIDDVTTLPLVRNGFDLMIGVGLDDNHYPALAYADKACVMDRSQVDNDVSDTRLIDRFAARDVSVVKHHGLIEAMLQEPIAFTDVLGKADQGLKHAVEVDAVEKLLKTMPEACVRTPFVAQRTALRKRLRKHGHRDVHTTFITPKSPPVIVSLAVHEATDEKAYAWLKGHSETLDMLHMPGVHVVADMRAIMQKSEGNDPILTRLHALEKQAEHKAAIGSIWELLALVAERPGGITLKEHVPVDALQSSQVKGLEGVLDVVLYNLNQHPIFAVASTQSVRGDLLNHDGIVRLVPDAGIELLHAAIACVKAAL